MQKITHQHLQTILQQLQRCTLPNTIPLLKLLNRLDYDHELNTQKNYYEIKEILNEEAVQNFMYGTCRLVIVKMIFDLVIDKLEWEFREQVKQMYREMLPILYEFAEKKCCIGIRQSYRKIIAMIKERKSEIFQYFLFVDFLLVEPAVLGILKQCKRLKEELFSKIHKHEHLSVWACIMINFLITKFKISSEVYYGLKNKYLKKNSQDNKKKERESQNSHKEKKNLIHDFNKFDKKSHHHALSEENKKFFQEIHQIVTTQKKQVDFDCFHEIKMRKSQDNRHLLNFNSPLSLFGSNYPRLVSFRCSRQGNLFSDKLGYRTTGSLDYSRIHKKGRIALSTAKEGSNRKQTEIVNRNNNFLFIAESLRLMVKNKQKKKQNFKPTKKMTVQSWKQRIKHIRYQSNVQKTTLSFLGTKKLKQLNSTEESDRLFIRKLPLKQSQESYPKNKDITVSGFTQHIDTREPKQMKIVKDVVNFTSYSPEKKQNRKIDSRQCRLDFENFLKKNQLWHEMYEEDNFEYRLQKCLTGTLKP